jgi:CheY-like chemotaxis protein
MEHGRTGSDGEPDGYEERVLLVDSDLPALEALREEFEADGYCVSIAGDGLDAICKLAEMGAPPVAIVTGMNMPWMSGPELIAFVRSDPELRSVVLMVITDCDATDLDAAVVGRPACYERCHRLIRQLRDTVPPSAAAPRAARGSADPA